MDEKLESFVTLLNKQRLARPAAPEPVRAPSWTQRVFSKRPEAPVAPVLAQAPQQSAPETVSDAAPAATPIVSDTATPAPVAADAAIASPVDATPAIAAPVEAAAAIESAPAPISAEASVELAIADTIAEAPTEQQGEVAAPPTESAAFASAESAPLESAAFVPEASLAAESTTAPSEPEAPVAVTPEEVQPVAAVASEEVAAAAPEHVAIAEAIDATAVVAADEASLGADTAASAPEEEIVATGDAEVVAVAAELAAIAEPEPIAAAIDAMAVAAAEESPLAADTVASAPEDIVAVPDPEAVFVAPEIAAVAEAEPIDAAIDATAVVASEEAPLAAGTVAPAPEEEIVAAPAAAEIAAIAESETVAAAIDATAVVASEEAPLAAGTVAPAPEEEIVAAPAAAEIAAVAEAEPIDAAIDATATVAAEDAPVAADPAALVPEDLVAAPDMEAAVEAAESPASTEAEPVAAAAPEISEDALAAEPAPVAAVADTAPVPALAPPRLAAIFAHIARPDSVSAAIAESAAAAVTPVETSPSIADVPVAAREDGDDAFRNPQDLLARFLAETEIAGSPAPEQVLAEAAAKLDEVLQAVSVEPSAPPKSDDEFALESGEDAEPAVPLSVMADSVAAGRASRGYLRYELGALAIVAGAVVVVGAYWSTQTISQTKVVQRDDAPPTAASPLKVATATPVTVPAGPSAAPEPAVPKLDVAARADAAPGAALPAAAAQIAATLPATKSGSGLTIVEAKAAPAPRREETATKLAQAPRQLAMLTPPMLEPPLPVTSSMAAPPPAAPPAPPAASAATAARGPQPTWQRNAMPAPPYSGKPQIAIVIDDLGIDHDRTERSVGLSPAVTLSFLAYASDLPTQTEAARRAGHELIVHVPMEPAIRPKYVSQTSGGEAQAELLRRLRWDLSRFTGYVGVNNHMGSRLSADPQAMRTVIGELKTRGLLFLDSRLDGDTIDVAQSEGVAAVGRDVLLDDDITAGSVLDRLAQVEKLARQNGTAIALGHPHDQTINALKLWIASLPAKGLQLVPLSAIVKDRAVHVAETGGHAG